MELDVIMESDVTMESDACSGNLDMCSFILGCVNILPSEPVWRIYHIASLSPFIEKP